MTEGVTNNRIADLIQRLTTQNEQERNEAELALMSLGQQAVRTLEEAVLSGIPVVGIRAARALGRFGLQALGSVPALIKALRGDLKGPYGAARTALIKIGHYAIPDLRHALKHGEQDIRPGVADVLFCLNSRNTDAASMWIGALDNNESEDICKWCFRGLMWLNGAAIDALIEALHHHNPRVRWNVADALMRERGSPNPFMNPAISLPALPALLDATKDKDSRVRYSASLTLLTLVEEAVDVWSRDLNNADPSEQLRVATRVCEIGRIAMNRMKELIIYWIKNYEPIFYNKRKYTIASVAAIPLISELCGHPNQCIKVMATEALCAIYHDISLLFSELCKQDCRAASHIYSILEIALKHRPDWIIELIDLLNRKDNLLVRHPVQADNVEIIMQDFVLKLQKQNTERNTVSLSEQYIVSLFVQFGENHVPRLTSLLRHRDPFIRRWIAEAFGEMGEEATEAIPELIDVLTSPEEEDGVLVAVSDTLVQIGEKAVPALIDAGRHPEDQVRTRVLRVLAQINPVPLIEGVMEPEAALIVHSDEDQQILRWFDQIYQTHLKLIQVFWCIGMFDHAALMVQGKAMGYRELEKRLEEQEAKNPSFKMLSLPKKESTLRFVCFPSLEEIFNAKPFQPDAWSEKETMPDLKKKNKEGTNLSWTSRGRKAWEYVDRFLTIRTLLPPIFLKTD